MSTTTPNWRERERNRVPKATEEEMAEAYLPLGFRDYCAHLLIPLNKCRNECFYLPWKCTAERHAYEKCQYKEFLRRKRWLEDERTRES